MEHTYTVYCETEGCEDNGEAINHITGITDPDTFEEAFGHGGEEEADFCPKCGKLGVLTEGD